MKQPHSWDILLERDRERRRPFTDWRSVRSRGVFSFCHSWNRISWSDYRHTITSSEALLSNRATGGIILHLLGPSQWWCLYCVSNFIMSHVNHKCNVCQLPSETTVVLNMKNKKYCSQVLMTIIDTQEWWMIKRKWINYLDNRIIVFVVF